MNKTDLYKVVNKKAQLSVRKSAEIVNLIFDAISSELESGNHVRLSGFGTFLIKRRKARKGKNLFTGEQMVIPEKNVVVFKPANALRVKVA